MATSAWSLLPEERSTLSLPVVPTVMPMCDAHEAMVEPRTRQRFFEAVVQLLAQLFVTAPEVFHEAAVVVQVRYCAPLGMIIPGYIRKM